MQWTNVMVPQTQVNVSWAFLGTLEAKTEASWLGCLLSLVEMRVQVRYSASVYKVERN